MLIKVAKQEQQRQDLLLEAGFNLDYVCYNLFYKASATKYFPLFPSLCLSLFPVGGQQ